MPRHPDLEFGEPMSSKTTEKPTKKNTYLQQMEELNIDSDLLTKAQEEDTISRVEQGILMAILEGKSTTEIHQASGYAEPGSVTKNIKKAIEKIKVKYRSSK